MYVEGVSTRKVSAITEALCGQQPRPRGLRLIAALLTETPQEWMARIYLRREDQPIAQAA